MEIYDENLSKCDATLEAKRVLLNEQLDKIANITLSQVNNVRDSIAECTFKCKENLNFSNPEFWSDLPNPKNNTYKTQSKNVCELDCDGLILSDLLNINNIPSPIIENKPSIIKDDSKALQRKYFNQWKRAIIRRETLLKTIDQKQKIDNFVRNLKKHNKLVKQNTTESKPEKIETVSYKNRFNAQKTIIETQKQKLDEQNKLIDDLKLGIFREDLMKSLENTKTDIREIFADCSVQFRVKAPHQVLDLDRREKFMVNTQKAPKIVQQMEQRAMERAQNREAILARKRLMEENRLRALAEAIERKQALEEEARKSMLEQLRERRKKELELEQVKQANKQRFLKNLHIALVFYHKCLLKNSFRKLQRNCETNRANETLAIAHFRIKQKQLVFNSWCGYIENKWKIKYCKADELYGSKLLKRMLQTWYNLYFDGVRSMQVAEDYYDFRLSCNSLIFWHRQVCWIQLRRQRKLESARKHYERRMVFHYFYLWRTLPAVVQLEKAKELKKQKWREKVWEVLPDYKVPPVEIDD